MVLKRNNSWESIDTSAATTTGGRGGAVPPSSYDARSNAATSKQSDYVDYLTSYEGMIRHQDLEFSATSGHMKGIFERIQTLGAKKNAEDRSGGKKSLPRGMLTYVEIRRCLLRLGLGWNRTHSVGTAADSDDEVSVLSLSSTSSAPGMGDILTTDAQLIMLLTTLVETDEEYRAYKSSEFSRFSTSYDLGEGLFLPEFIQAYKLIIAGMQSLKSMPGPAHPTESYLYNRVKQRTMLALRPFGPNAKMYRDDCSETRKEDALSPKKHSLRNALGRNFSKSDVKKVMRSKDITLARILEDHELEMDALASNMHKLRLEEQGARIALRKRRKRMRWLAVALGGILIGGGIAESRRRRHIMNEIALEREAERAADANTIARLKETKHALETKLIPIEGKMRFQLTRNKKLQTQMQGIENEIASIDKKSLVEKAEIEGCIASQIEFSGDLKREKSRELELKEELIWCRSRLSSRERELNEFEYGKKSAISKTDGDKNRDEIDKPVYLEMKYNKPIRNAMLMRQTYSAAAGLVVGALFQGLIPVVIKLLFAPKAAIAPLPLPPNRNVEMAIVDGIFGSSIAFLLLQAVATLMPF
ncbi:hypothetical protein ACHAWF_007914 [Thalassiosira exigua]